MARSTSFQILVISKSWKIIRNRVYDNIHVTPKGRHWGHGWRILFGRITLHRLRVHKWNKLMPLIICNLSIHGSRGSIIFHWRISSSRCMARFQTCGKSMDLIAFVNCVTNTSLMCANRFRTPGFWSRQSSSGRKEMAISFGVLLIKPEKIHLKENEGVK